MKVLSILAASLFMTAGVAIAAAPGAAEDATPKAEAAEKEKKVCKTEKMTGSLTRVRRICMTRAEWNEMAENTNRSLDRLGRSANQAEALTNRSAAGAGGGPPPGGGHTF